MYLEDIYTAVANVTGLPAISVPVWFAEDEGVSLPVWLQIMPKRWDEGTMFGVAHHIEKTIQL
jgi:aspartyl-tRNA(Asn)/glutamyl-tRNA(Gln) amidotransferase subunit A